MGSALKIPNPDIIQIPTFKHKLTPPVPYAHMVMFRIDILAYNLPSIVLSIVVW